jgi:nucleoside-diphosphate-sugar epimerase
MHWKKCGYQENHLGNYNLVSDTLLIIGGTGFIGRKLALRAVKIGFKVIVLSLNKPTLEQKVNHIQYIQVDIADSNLLFIKLSSVSCDYIVNLSGYINHSSFFNEGKNVINVHLVGIINILHSLNLSNLKRFVQIGSSDEYGNSIAPQTEDMRESPISPYSFAKAAASDLLQMLHKTEGIPIVILRLFLVYGPGQNYDRFMPQIIRGCFSSSNFSTSAGQQLRDFCYIDDIIDGIILALKNDEVNGKIINLASGKPIKVREVVELVQKLIGRGGADFGKIPYRTGENMALYADILKANKILDWRPNISIEDGIQRTIDYYR